MKDYKPSSIPINLNVANSLLFSKPQADRATIMLYQSAIGSFMLHGVHTRPDSSYSVRVFSRYCANPDPIYCNLVMQIFRYLAETLVLGITFKSNVTDELVGYTDSDWAGLKDGQRLTSGYAFFFPVDLYLINRGNKRLLLNLQLRQNIWLQQKLEKKPCGLVDFKPL